MIIKDIISQLDALASPNLQEHYDNCGLLVGDEKQDCTGVLIALDATQTILQEAIDKKCNLLVLHHPVIFSGLKKITGGNYVEDIVIKAIKNNIAIYAIHTNLDNVLEGVNGKIAEKLALQNIFPLEKKKNTLQKIFTFVPQTHADTVRKALFAAGAGNIGNYSECSFNTAGTGTFKAQGEAKPFVGEIDKLHEEAEIKVEAVYPSFLKNKIITALLQAHPYEEVAYDIVLMENEHPSFGSGIVGELATAINIEDFFKQMKKIFNLSVIRHTDFLQNKKVKRIAVCGGAGSFLIKSAIRAKADVYITADVKYHDFFDAYNQLVIADIGHYESEQFTVELLYDFLVKKFPNFAVLKTAGNTNPVRYFI